MELAWKYEMSNLLKMEELIDEIEKYQVKYWELVQILPSEHHGIYRILFKKAVIS